MRNEKKEPKTQVFIAGAIVTKTDKCILWPFSINAVDGYAYFGTERGGRHKTYRAHTYVCKIVHGARPTPEHHAAHSCHNRICINPRHVSWKTPSKNMQDKHENGTAFLNGNGRKGKLTVDQVIKIRALEGKMTQEATAKKFGVTQSNIRQIQTRKIWKHVA